MSNLKAVGVFWDIENCHVPKGKSALKIIERIRQLFFYDCREAEFICVCDINKESDTTIKDLNDGQINVVHINATAKNAADDKIRQSLRRFSDSHPPETKVILISSDVNFASDLSDLRHRKRFHVILIHKAQVSEALLACASEHHQYEDLIKDLPDRPGYKEVKDHLLVIYGYSKDGPLDKVRQILKMQSNNCGGKVVSIGPLFAVLKFETADLLERARKRMNGEDVYGRKITVCLPEETPFYNTVRKLASSHLSKRQESPSPQRSGRYSRDYTGSRSNTPESYENTDYPTSHLQNFSSEYYSDNIYGTNSMGQHWNQYNYNSSKATYDSRPYNKTPGGPVYQQPSYGKSQPSKGQGTSPSHTHTLPNSNSEKYYSSKGPPSQENSPFAQNSNSFAELQSSGTSANPQAKGSASNTISFYLGDKNNVASSQEKSTGSKTEKLSLADIPIPSFGFRDIPPPSLSAVVSAPANLDPTAAAFDPIKLVETASRDTLSALNKNTKGNLLGPGLQPEHPDSQQPPSLSVHYPAYSGNFNTGNLSTKNNNSNSQFTYSQNSAFTKRQSVTASVPLTQHQSRSMSVPVHHNSNTGQEKLSIEDEICLMHGYPPASAYRSHSQNSDGFKKPASPHRSVKNQNTGAPNRRQSPGGRPSVNRSNSRELRHSLSSDSEDRPYSPVILSITKQSFRPRLASAPSSGISGRHPSTRTPSPLAGPNPIRPRPKQYGSNLYRVPTPNEIGEPSTDYLHPEFNSNNDPYVELIVSNLDYNIHPREWRKIIYATFHPHVKILSIQVRLQADNTSVATVRLPSEQDARFAIAQFHRRKIGYKRINVQFKSDTSQSPADSLRADTIALLMEAKDNKMALSRLIDLFDKRFHKTVSISDVYKMRDIIQIIESGGAGRWVVLKPGVRRSPTPVHMQEGEMLEVLEQPVCPIHCAEGTVYYTEALNACMLPNVQLLRKHFSPQLHSLLLSHNGYIPLMSFPACYAAEFQPIEPVREGGIPLEHVISCVPGVEISVSKVGVKVIQFQENRDQFYDMMKGNSWQELGKISREVMELLRQQPTCSMPVSKFIPAYHHYFGKQCRVADYGYTKLQELFEAIPHAIQILGTGDRKSITLSSRAQLKRFTTDILKVVKAQPTKQILLQDFPSAYEKVMYKPLFLPHYGVCYMEDVLTDIPTTTLIVIEEGSDTLLALPRRDQTPEEVERTKQFALEVVDLLRHNPQCRMPFNKFIPAYHHHFGRQCRVADYGFSKLTDLFEAVAHVVEIEEEGEERLIHLSPAELRKVLCEQLSSLLRPVGAIPVDRLLKEYAKHFGFCLKLEEFGVDSIKALLQKLKNNIKIEVRNGQECATLVREFHIPQLGLQVMQLLMDESGGSLPLMELCMRYESLFHVSCDFTRIKEELSDFVQIDEGDSESGGVIRLTSQQMLGRNLRLLLLHHECIAMSDLPGQYRQQYGVELSPALYGFASLYQLLLSFPHILEVKGKPAQKYIVLSGILATPGTLPPARVDVLSPTHYSSSSSSAVGESMSASSCEMSTHSTPPQGSNPIPASDLQHASQLWDPSIIKQGSATTSTDVSTNIMDLLNANMGSVSLQQSPAQTAPGNTGLSPHGVPFAWQMRAGGEKPMNTNLANIFREISASTAYTNGGVQGGSNAQSTTQPPAQSIEQPQPLKILMRTKPGRHRLGSPAKHSPAPDTVDERGDSSCQLSQPVKVINASDLEEEMHSAGSSVPETSSATSQETSSSPCNLASPAKRKTRIAAKFGVHQ